MEKKHDKKELHHGVCQDNETSMQDDTEQAEYALADDASGGGIRC